MKKKWIVSGAVLLTLVLAACGNKGKTVESSSSTKETHISTSESTTKSTTTKESSTTKSSNTTGTTQAASSKETATSAEPAGTITPENQASGVLKELSSSFPQQGLPNAILTSSTNVYLTAATTGAADQANFRILYYAEKTVIPVNDPVVNQLKPIASFQKITYGSADEAKNIVNQIIDNGGQAVDLGHNIIGHQQGAAGSSFLSWQEGNWNLVVRASNVQGENPKPLATSIVELLESEMLPAPKSVGQITLMAGEGTDYQRNSVVWQEGTTVYTICHFDPVQAVKMATSL